VDWDSVDPIPPALAEIVRRPVAPGVEIPLDDVVPGEPERVLGRMASAERPPSSESEWLVAVEGAKRESPE
jgi:hypothetical protein